MTIFYYFIRLKSFYSLFCFLANIKLMVKELIRDSAISENKFPELIFLKYKYRKYA